MNSDVARFLVKVLVASLAVSALIKVGGPSLPVQNLEGRSLNQLAIIVVTIPSIMVAIFLSVKSRS